VPYVFEADPHGHIETIKGIPVRKVEFQTYQQYSDYQKHHKNTIYENESPKEIQFLSEWYHTIPDNQIDPPALKVYSIDIEVNCTKGFPKAEQAAWPISLINVREFGGGANKSWGLKPYTGEYELDYVHCESEQDLMLQFFHWWHKNAPDVVTGWNIAPHNKTNERGGFDLPYIVNRSKNLFGKKADHYKKLSPIGIVRCWDDNKSGAMYVDIAGVSVLDYFALYKWYTTNNPENYKLDTIAREELGLGKLDYGDIAADLRTLYDADWNLYVEYNVIDNKRIEDLEDKLGYILLAQSLALLCRCKMEHYTAATHLVEGLMLTHFRRNDLCAPRMEGGHQEWFPAAYVKEPQKGQYDWVVDLDIASSYPTAIITLNMSSETYYGRCVGYKDMHGRWIDTITGRADIDITEIARLEAPICDFVKKREFPVFKLLKDDKIILMKGDKLDSFNKALQKGLLCCAPSGSMYLQNKKGAFAHVEQMTYIKRQEINGLKKEFKGKASRARNPDTIAEHTVQANKHHALQWALKIVLNSMYGVTGVPYSRYFNVHTAEAIASCGRRSIITGQRYVNRWFNDGVWKNEETLAIIRELGECNLEDVPEDMVAYIDTDSVFIKLGQFIDRVVGGDWKTAHDQEFISDRILSLSKHLETYVNDCSYLETQVAEYNSIMSKEEFSIVFKQEIVCKSALFITKKKYGYHVVNEEGTPCDNIDVTGMEIIRSETPSAFKDALKELLGMVLRNAPDDAIYESYTRHKKSIKYTYPEEISENKGVKGLGKWLKDGEPMKGTPYHVKAVAAYHKLLKELDLFDDYPIIEEDTKNKLVYVKYNPFGIKCVMYDRWPKEFTDAGVEPDFKVMTEKFLTNKLKMLLEPAKRVHILEQNQAFNAFFT